MSQRPVLTTATFRAFGVCLAAIVWLIVVGDIYYFYELRIARKIEQAYGAVTFARRSDLRRSDRVVGVSMAFRTVTPQLMADIGKLRNLRALSLTSTDVTDDDLERLKGLSNLEELYVNYTQTTRQGRTRLRTALPRCRIYPEP